MSTSRATAEAVSLVWRVESTRWPVKDACTAISAVSLSLISPTIMMSGSCLSMERRPLAKVSPIFGFTCTCPMPFNWYSTGSSTVMMFLTVELMEFMAE